MIKKNNVLFLISIGILVFLMFFYFRFRSLDDVYIYFNYAKKFTEGYYFSYDYRNIPSEGFTSMLYMLLLIVLQYLNFDLIYSSIALNFFFLFGSIYTFYLIIFNVLKFNKKYIGSYFFMILLLIFIQAYGLYPLLGFSLETYMALFVSSILVYFFFLIINKDQPSTFNFLSFFFMYFLLFLSRPEAVFYFLPLPIGLLIHKKDNFIKILVAAFFGIILLVSYLAIKYSIFGDFLPTGYYRKLTTNTAHGLGYIAAFLKYSSYLLLLILIGFIGSRYLKLNTNKYFIGYLGCIAVCNVIFFIFSTPLVGIFFRFLIFANFYLVIICVYLFLVLLEYLESSKFKFSKFLKYYPILVLIMVLPIFHYIYNGRIHDFSEGYVRLGKDLDKTFKDMEVTYLLGEAGAIPYYSSSNFIDLNGLSEPYIAKLFKDKDNPNRRTEKELLDYAENQGLDFHMKLLDTKGSSVSDSVVFVSEDAHSPLNGKKTFSLYKLMKEKGYVYAGNYYCDETVGFNFLVRRNTDKYSEVFSRIKKSLVDTTKSPKRIYYTNKSDTVVFERQ